MKVSYDEKVDTLYLQLGTRKPEGVIEISEGVNLDVTEDGKIVGIEILNSSQKININTFLTYQLDLKNDSLNFKKTS